jgi:hypothetical protein
MTAAACSMGCRAAPAARRWCVVAQSRLQVDEMLVRPFDLQPSAVQRMEIEPRYAQVAIERWQAFTGETAERV